MDIRSLLTDIQAVFGFDVVHFLNQVPIHSQEAAKKREAELKAEIKKLFKQLSVKHHPDKTGGDDTVFKQLSRVYQDAIKNLNVNYNPPVPMQVVHIQFGGGFTTGTTATFNYAPTSFQYGWNSDFFNNGSTTGQ